MQWPGPRSKCRRPSATKGSLWVAGGLLFYDVALDGCYTLSITICPWWFLISVVKNLIWRPGWRIAVIRLAMPILTLAIAVTNGNLQWRISDANARRVINACDGFRAVNGRYPTTLDELVPTYLPSVPPAKYCMMGHFLYINWKGHCTLMWSRWGFYRRTYDFDAKRWSNVD
jgi:hypothetical protein